MRKVFIGIFLLGSFIFLAHWWIVGSAVWGDGRYYYSYVRSLIIDRDLDFTNEFEHFGEPILFTKKGRVANKYSIGASFFWLPGFILAYFLEKGNGYSHLYQVLVGLNSVFLGILGLWFCWRIVSFFFSSKIALGAVLAIWLGSNLFFYTVVDPINSHSASFFVASLIGFLIGKLKKIPKSFGLEKLILIGGLVGVLGMIRTQDLIFAVPLGIWLGKRGIKKIIGFIIGVGIGFLPQILVWKELYGEITSPYLLAGEKFNWLKPKIFSVLFSQNNGLFYYSPILILGLGGILIELKREWWARIGFFLFLMETYIISSWHIWWGGASYGGRMYLSLMPFFAAGLAAFLDKFKKISFLNFIVITILVILNFYSMIKFLIINL